MQRGADLAQAETRERVPERVKLVPDGKLLAPLSPADMEMKGRIAFASEANIQQEQYMIGVSPDGKFHAVKLTSKNKGLYDRSLMGEAEIEKLRESGLLDELRRTLKVHKAPHSEDPNVRGSTMINVGSREFAVRRQGLEFVGMELVQTPFPDQKSTPERQAEVQREIGNTLNRTGRPSKLISEAKTYTKFESLNDADIQYLDFLADLDAMIPERKTTKKTKH